MRSIPGVSSVLGTQCVKLVLIAALCLVLNSAAAFSQTRSLEELVSAVVQVKTYIDPRGELSIVWGASARAPASSSTTKVSCSPSGT